METSSKSGIGEVGLRCEDACPKYLASAAGPETSIKKSLGRHVFRRILRMLRKLASRTGVEPVSPP